MGPCPELIVVSGPQKGQRLAIVGNSAVAGRSRDVNIELTEDYVSRRQMKFELTHEGWIVENLSSNGTMINGKRYKAGMQILLATGDVLGVGLQTEILFVAQGDDPQEALEAYGRAQPQSAPAPQAPPAEPAMPAGQEAPVSEIALGEMPGPREAAAAPAGRQAKRESVDTGKLLSADDAKASAKRAKYKKYAIFFGIYLSAFAVVIILLVGRGEGPGTVAGSLPPQLSDDDIRDALTALPEQSRNSTAAAEALRKAQAMFQGRNIRTGDLYRCVKQYKLYRAYRGGAEFEAWDDQQNYSECLYGRRDGPKGLVTQVTEEYHNAMAYETHQHYRDALERLDRLRQLVPEEDHRDPTYQKLLTNVFEHYSCVQKLLPRKGKSAPLRGQ